MPRPCARDWTPIQRRPGAARRDEPELHRHQHQQRALEAVVLAGTMTITQTVCSARAAHTARRGAPRRPVVTVYNPANSTSEIPQGTTPPDDPAFDGGGDGDQDDREQAGEAQGTERLGRRRHDLTVHPTPGRGIYVESDRSAVTSSWRCAARDPSLLWLDT